MRKNSKPSLYLQLSVLDAFKHIARDTFRHLNDPAPSLMWAVIKAMPVALARMPQAQNKAMQIEALRGDGKLLGAGLDWKFNTEREFPGSKAWSQHYRQPLIEYFRVLDFSSQEELDTSWQVISKFSIRPAWSISQQTRDLLAFMPYYEGAAMMQRLLQIPIGGTLPPISIDESIASSLARACD